MLAEVCIMRLGTQQYICTLLYNQTVNYTEINNVHSQHSTFTEKNKDSLHNNNVSSSEMMQGGGHRVAARQSDSGLVFCLMLQYKCYHVTSNACFHHFKVMQTVQTSGFYRTSHDLC